MQGLKNVLLLFGGNHFLSDAPKHSTRGFWVPKVFKDFKVFRVFKVC